MVVVLLYRAGMPRVRGGEFWWWVWREKRERGKRGVSVRVGPAHALAERERQTQKRSAWVESRAEVESERPKSGFMLVGEGDQRHRRARDDEAADPPPSTRSSFFFSPVLSLQQNRPTLGH
jgi:hypothetical protein